MCAGAERAAGAQGAGNQRLHREARHPRAARRQRARRARARRPHQVQRAGGQRLRLHPPLYHHNQIVTPLKCKPENYNCFIAMRIGTHILKS